ncbi:MAG: 3'-5' exonuclease [Anaerolineales bacterium]
MERSVQSCAFILVLLATMALGAASGAQTPPKAKGIESEGYVWNEMIGEKMEALRYQGDPERGKEAYEVCSACHLPSGAGRPDGTFPQLAGQHRTVLIKQIADIREGRRDNPIMYPFSWKSLGVDIRGRSKTLRINYRTSHQIRMQADKLLDPELSDVDGITEERGGTISIFNGPAPTIDTFNTPEAEIEAVSQWLEDRITAGIEPEEIGVFVRSVAELPRAISAVEKAGLAYKVLDGKITTTVGNISLCTMHLAKGLEFRAVAVMACDDEVIPLQARIEKVTDTADLEEVYNTERHLLYVACTRARDHLLVTSVEPASEFLDDLQM